MKQLHSFLLVLFLSVGISCASAFTFGYSPLYEGYKTKELEERKGLNVCWAVYDFNSEDSVFAAMSGIGFICDSDYEEFFKGSFIPLTVGFRLTVNKNIFFTGTVGVFSAREVIGHGWRLDTEQSFPVNREYHKYLDRHGACGSLFVDAALGPVLVKFGCLGGKAFSASISTSYGGVRYDDERSADTNGYFFFQPQVSIGLNF